MRNPIKRAIKAIQAVVHRYSEPLRLELSLVDHCNLNCKGCTHYCPIAPEHYMPLDGLERDLAHLAGVDNAMFRHIYLLGGEPLLHPEINRAMELSRCYFPAAGIRLLTNGLLVMRMPQEFWDTCRATGTVISVTIYPVKTDYRAIEAECLRQGVEYEIFHQPQGDTFFSKHTIDDINPGNRHINFLRCYQAGCLTLRDGRIYPCATSAYVEHINNRFDRHFETCHGDYVDAMSVRHRRDLIRLKNRPTRFCRYCTRLTPMAWAPSRRQPSEWLP
ncbi:MAG: radical SAM protein [Muribaculaceae bacterium]|nr:radical SAM protein [Muribaculaceae bacterium]